MKKWNKRGQFYLIAAIVILSVIFGFVAITDYTQKNKYIESYSLRDKLKIESDKVIDYSIYNKLSKAEMQEKIDDLAKLYSENVNKNIEIIFISGYKDDATNTIKVYSFENGIRSDLDSPTIENEDIKVDVKGKNYIFQSKEGENFHFIIFQNIEGENYIVTSTYYKGYEKL